MWDLINSLLHSFNASFDPYRILLTAFVGMMWFLIRNMVRSQLDISRTLNNHLSEIRKGLEDIHTHMELTNKILESVLDKVLDAALRKKE